MSAKLSLAVIKGVPKHRLETKKSLVLTNKEPSAQMINAFVSEFPDEPLEDRFFIINIEHSDLLQPVFQDRYVIN